MAETGRSDIGTNMIGARSTTDLADEAETGPDLQSVSMGAPPLGLAHFGATKRFAGTVHTCETYEDNAVLRGLLSRPGDGGVMVVDGRGSTRVALCGDMMAALAVEHGWAGLIIHGAVRDRLALAEIGVGIVAMGTTPRRSAKHGIGRAEVPVAFGGALFRPGDWLAADEDGIVVLPGPPASPGPMP